MSSISLAFRTSSSTSRPYVAYTTFAKSALRPVSCAALSARHSAGTPCARCSAALTREPASASFSRANAAPIDSSSRVCGDIVTPRLTPAAMRTAHPMEVCTSALLTWRGAVGIGSDYDTARSPCIWRRRRRISCCRTRYCSASIRHCMRCRMRRRRSALWWSMPRRTRLRSIRAMLRTGLRRACCYLQLCHFRRRGVPYRRRRTSR